MHHALMDEGVEDDIPMDVREELARRGISVRRTVQRAIFGHIILAETTSCEDDEAERYIMKLVSKKMSLSGLCLKGTPVFENHEMERLLLRKVRLSRLDAHATDSVDSRGASRSIDERNETGQIRNEPHPNLLCLLAEEKQVETREWRCLGLPFVEGGELFEYVKKKQCLNEDECRSMARDIAKGLYHLHTKIGFCHNDISLENVLLRGDLKTPVICDYGLAQEIGSVWNVNKQVSGKLPYQAPEIYSATAKVALPSADVFSFGVALFVMLAGIPPFEVPDPLHDMRYKYIQCGKMKKLLELWRIRLSDHAINLLTGMLSHDPRQRMTMEKVFAHEWMQDDRLRFAGRMRHVAVEEEDKMDVSSSSPNSVFNFDSTLYK